MNSDPVLYWNSEQPPFRHFPSSPSFTLLSVIPAQAGTQMCGMRNSLGSRLRGNDAPARE
jgi:hypothetical protein